MTTSAETIALWDCPLAGEVERLQDEGRTVYVVGFTDDGRYALVRSEGGYSVAPRDTANGLGRWECPAEHYHHHAGTYHARFPRR